MSGAKSDLEEAMQNEEDAESLAAFVVAAGLAPSKKGEADELFECVTLNRCTFLSFFIFTENYLQNIRSTRSPSTWRR